MFIERLRKLLGRTKEPGLNGSNVVEHSSREEGEQIKQSVAELLALFTDATVIPWPDRKKVHLPEYDHEVRVITNARDRTQRTESSLDSGPGVTMIKLLPTQDYKNLPAIYEFYYIVADTTYSHPRVMNHLTVKFYPDKEEPSIKHASDIQDINEPWYHNLDYPPGHHLDVIKKITEIAKLKKEDSY